MITKLTVQNFKCFLRHEFVFPSLAVLTGLNGTGKSTVLQSLLVLRQSFDQNMLQRNRLALNGDLVQIGRASDALCDQATQEEIGIHIETSSANALDVKVKYQDQAEILEGVNPVQFPDAILREPIFCEELCYLSAERIGPRTSFSLSEPALRQKKIGVHGEYTAQLLAAIGDQKLTLPRLQHERAVSLQLRDQVEAWLSYISPGVRIVATEFPAIDIIQLAYSFERATETSSSFRPTNVGFGITYILPVLVALLSAKEGALVLIENPEAHLHPRGQVLLGELLIRAASAGIQVICETHSDHVVNGIRVAIGRQLQGAKPEHAAIYFFSRDGVGAHKVQRLGIDAKGRIDDWPQDFFDQWDNSLEELIRIKAAEHG